MIEITDLAAEKLADYIAKNNLDSTVRIHVMNNCGGPALTLALDEKKADDLVHEDELFTLVMDQGVAEMCGKVTLDYIKETLGCGCGGGGGFSLSSEKPLNGGQKDCSTSCSSGGCCG